MDQELSPAHVKWLEDERGISASNVRDLGIYSGQRRSTGDGKFEVVPHPKGEVIVFPYEPGNPNGHEKYRGSDKTFYQKSGTERGFYNSAILDDAQLTDGRATLVIVEGEIDLLSVREAGNPFVVSVPDGAPPAHGKPLDDDFDPAQDTKYQYFYRDWERLKKIKRIVIATDADAPGQRLAEELVRRLGRDRCSFVEWPADCKDMNDVLLNFGAAEVARLINIAKPYPVSGVYTFDELPLEPELTPVTTGFGRLDEYLLVYYPAFMVVTGIAGSGKSTLTNQMVAQIVLRHGWRVAIASFEMRIKPFVSNTLINTYLEYNQKGDGKSAQRWVQDNFIFIAPEPGREDDAFDIEWLIQKAISAVIRYGIRVLVIDPWNEIEHAVRRGESGTDYVGRAIRALKRFGREFECLVIVVAHPTKAGANKAPDEISLYDVSDSQHFANKADLGIVVARQGGDKSYVSTVFVKKIRYQPTTGRPGRIELTYDPKLRIFGQ